MPCSILWTTLASGGHGGLTAILQHFAGCLKLPELRAHHHTLPTSLQGGGLCPGRLKRARTCTARLRCSFLPLSHRGTPHPPLLAVVPATLAHPQLPDNLRVPCIHYCQDLTRTYLVHYILPLQLPFFRWAGLPCYHAPTGRSCTLCGGLHISYTHSYDTAWPCAILLPGKIFVQVVLLKQHGSPPGLQYTTLPGVGGSPGGGAILLQSTSTNILAITAITSHYRRDQWLWCIQFPNHLPACPVYPRFYGWCCGKWTPPADVNTPVLAEHRFTNGGIEFGPGADISSR